MARREGSIHPVKRGGRVVKNLWRIRWPKGTDASGARIIGSENVWGSKKQAATRLREVLGRKDKGLPTPSPSRMPTFSAQVETWKASETAKKMRDRTRRDYVELFDRYVIPKLGGWKLDAIHTSTIEAEVTGPLTERKRYRTAQRCVCAISVVYRDALKDPTLGLNGNPARGVSVGTGEDTDDRAEVKPLSNDERAAFRAAIKGTALEPLWLLMNHPGFAGGSIR
jgi:hypothetical protein